MKDSLKKIGSLLVCISLVGALVSCGGKSKKNDGNKIEKRDTITETQKPKKTKITPETVPSETAKVSEIVTEGDGSNPSESPMPSVEQGSTIMPVPSEKTEVAIVETIAPTEVAQTQAPVAPTVAPAQTETIKVTAPPAVADKPENTANETDSVKTVAEGYLKATVNVDADSALKYVDKDSDLYDDVEDGTMSSVVDSLTGVIPKEYAKNVEPAIATLIEAVKSNSSYTIGTVTCEGDTATVTYSVTSLDIESGLETAMETVETKISAKYTKDDLKAMASDEQKLAEVMVETINLMMGEVAKTNKTKTINGTLSLQKIDGAWLVVDETAK